MAIIRVSGTCDSGSTPDRTISFFFLQSIYVKKISDFFCIVYKMKTLVSTIIPVFAASHVWQKFIINKNYSILPKDF